MTSKTNLDIVFGAMTFGKEGEEQVRTSSLSTCSSILSTYQSHGGTSLDTSRFYGNGTSETHLAALNWSSLGLSVATKFYPNTAGLLGRPETHLSRADMRAALTESLHALGDVEKVDLWYLHAPDRSVPLEETLAVVDELYKEGKFDRWGVSNFMAWEVSAICEICDRNGWLRPAVYQGMYNALHRTVENELLPCLRKYGISFYAFNPLAGGYLTGRYRRDMREEEVEEGSRFDSKRVLGRMYRARFWNESFWDALEVVREEVGKVEVRESEAALRWLMHHSKLERRFGDKVIIGASSEVQLRQNMEDFEKGPLGEGVLGAFDKGWEMCRGVTWKYFH